MITAPRNRAVRTARKGMPSEYAADLVMRVDPHRWRRQVDPLPPDPPLPAPGPRGSCLLRTEPQRGEPDRAVRGGSCFLRTEPQCGEPAASVLVDQAPGCTLAAPSQWWRSRAF